VADRTPSRRRLLKGVAGLGAFFWVPRLAIAADPHQHHMSSTTGLVPRTRPPSMDAPFTEPEVRRSANGVLQTSLRAAYAYREVGGVRLYVRSYEGGSPGPTLRMKPGETLKIRLTNDFPPNRDLMPFDISNPHQFNNTNFHFHGSHASPSGIADNVMRSMVPGESYDIEIALPKDHTKGTYWYHPHHHGSADVQMSSGMVGAIIVEGDFAEVPEIANAQERLLVLAQVVYDARGMIENFETLFPETATRFLTVNGQRRPTITMRPGEVQRWRILNAAYQDDMLLELEKHELNAVAYDGIQLGAMETMKTHLIAPGQRADMLVRAGPPGTYELRALPYDQGHPSPVGPLARVVVAGEPMNMKLPAALPKPPFEAIKDSEITGKRTLVFSATCAGGRCCGPLAGVRFLHRRQEVRSEPHRPAGQARSGRGVDDREHARARRPRVPHSHQSLPRHQDERQAAGHAAVARHGDRRAQGWQPHLSQPVPRLYRHLHAHCHMMNHEEMGMMQTVEVYKE
jgi:FtsP/CotA-like multicopper oxidase with cupredoxin domain